MPPVPPCPPWLRAGADCLFCGALAEPSGPALCAGCEAALPWLGPHCRQCALPLSAVEVDYCGSCLATPPAFDRVIAAWRYDFPIDAAITRFKHAGRRPFGQLLGDLLGRHVREMLAGEPLPMALLPVPLAAARLRQRGFNQAEQLARRLGKALNIPVRGWLERIRDTASQQGLDATTRRRNLRDAFRLRMRPPSGAYLALVDDVLTTGATAEALAGLLKKAGAERVDLFCLARTPKPQDV